MKATLLLLLSLCCSSILIAKPTQLTHAQSVQQFITDMVQQHHFNKHSLEKLFKTVRKNQTVINLLNKPYEAKPWYQYQKLFVSDSHVKNGVIFWRKYRHTLAIISQKTGVPPQIIVAILGIESHYGQRKGVFSALRSLYTFAFYYPRRALFFKHELEQFLILCREQGWDPLTIKGSYTAALGQPQFMPSSYRSYAKSYQHDKKANLFNNETDVIASVANYFVEHHWRKQQPIAIKAKFDDSLTTNVPITEHSSSFTKPKLTLRQYLNYGAEPVNKTRMSRKATLLRYELNKGHDYWFGFYNFYVITRYNSSILYAMAVYQLAEKISAQYHRQYSA